MAQIRANFKISDDFPFTTFSSWKILGQGLQREVPLGKGLVYCGTVSGIALSLVPCRAELGCRGRSGTAGGQRGSEGPELSRGPCELRTRARVSLQFRSLGYSL